ncbi:MAG: fumarylacetoacetate hydrolase family protein, partial [Desulfobacterales bacterium]
DFVERERFETGNPISFRLEVNGRTRQQGLQSDMLFSFEEIISAVSEFITLEPGDAVFTGTPEGVGSVHAGDCLESYLNGDKNLTVDVLAGK